MENHSLLKNFKFWRYLINAWSIFFFVFIIMDFISNNAYLEILSAISMIYIGILAIYVSNKEFERWYDRHQSEHPGEIFVVIWTVLIFLLLILEFIFAKSYTMPNSVLSAYIAVLTILVITEKSKEMYYGRLQTEKKIKTKKPIKTKK